MPMAKIAVSIDQKMVHRIDGLVLKGFFPSRSKAIQEAIEYQLQRLDRRRLAIECAKLDPNLEQKAAEEGMQYEVGSWAEY